MSDLKVKILMRKSSMVLLTTALIALFFVGGVLIHEQTHVEIAEMYGCNAEITPYPVNNTVMHVTWSCPNQNYREVEEMQNVVEASGYQVVPIYIVLGFIVSVQIITLYMVVRLWNRYPY